ncbi:MAG TPA: hypothetical protein ENN64_00615, partial [bacterium]|nr:hypothetical protein [bacterium]
ILMRKLEEWENILNSVFKAYDVRGVVGEELDEEFYYYLGRALVRYLNTEHIVVGRDFREDSLRFQTALISGIHSLKCYVTDISEISTEMLYFAVGENADYDIGAVVTASHNPAGYNGCKLVKKNARPIYSQDGFEELKKLILKDIENFQGEQIDNLNDKNYQIDKKLYREIDIMPAYREKILSFLKGVKIKPLSIVVDAGNGIGGKIFKEVFKDFILDDCEANNNSSPKTPEKRREENGIKIDSKKDKKIKLTELYFEPDSLFPNHDANPIEIENMLDLQKKVVEVGADLGIGIDGDGDRVGFVDNSGEILLSGVFIGAILADYVFDTDNKRLIHDLRIISPIVDTVKELGGEAIPSIAGHAYIKESMLKHDAKYGVELSTHFYYKDYYYCDSGMVTVAFMIKAISGGLNLAKKHTELRSKYHLSGEVNFEISDPEAIINELIDTYKDSGNIDLTDGVSCELKGWRFNVRISNTQPLLRLNVESDREDLMIEGYKELENLIGGTRKNEPSFERKN